MSISAEEAFRTIIIQSALGARLQTPGTTRFRVYPQKLPPNAQLPALVYTRVDTPRTGRSHTSSGMPKAHMQLDIWATGYGEVVDLADLAISALDGFRGDVGGTWIGWVFNTGDSRNEDPDTTFYRGIQDYEIQYSGA